MSDDDTTAAADKAVGVERSATIYEVAEAAGVSPSTVSRTFSRPGRVSVRTADHVREVAAKLGYRVDGVFRPTTPARTRTIGLAVADVTNPFYFGILRGAEWAAARAGYTLLLVDAQESDVLERENLSRILPLVDGLVVGSTRTSDTVLRSISKNTPVVILNRHVGGLACVVPDSSRGMRRAVEHLVGLGHQSIHYLAGPDASWINGMRWLAMREASYELGFSEHRIGPTAPTVEGGQHAAVQVVGKGAKAVICYNDVMAMGLMRGLADMGVKVPEEVSVIGFDNIFASDLVTPRLTTVAAPLTTLGETAVKHIVAMVGGARPRGDEPTIVPVRLIVRQSTAAPSDTGPRRRQS
ncbi:MAG TPA: LacI family DNA-binding transcriptional regulator [Propionibacteriaceae bacterium]|nr:LacI family DNA-binding transcriptional regulator [Propionibacteriaceae bacterium]HPZ48622.1 LacI family DNA-binding transcriptional regulator [Propionibacteriaceae bacterium]HQE32837.1 LacI family DNA-binding transcriptional regulator [Propionibacteriaceae bacterium]